MAAVLAVVSDLHCGSTLGLLAPDTPGEDGQLQQPSPAQRWLWGCWKAFWSEVWTLKTKYHRRLLVVVNGDLTDGDGNNVVQRWTRDLEVQAGAAVKLLGPIAEMADVTVVTRGTAFHVRHGGQADKAVAKLIGARCFGDDPAPFRALLDVEGLRVDVAHHIRLTSLPWTSGGNAIRMAAQFRDRAADSGQLPDLVFRSHAHKCADSGASRKPRVVVTPAWQLITEFGHRLAAIEPAHIGGVIVVVEGGRYDLAIRRYDPGPDEAVSV